MITSLSIFLSVSNVYKLPLTHLSSRTSTNNPPSLLLFAYTKWQECNNILIIKNFLDQGGTRTLSDCVLLLCAVKLLWVVNDRRLLYVRILPTLCVCVWFSSR